MQTMTQSGNNKPGNARKRMLYQAGNLLYLAGWALTLVGLALVQDECKDHERTTGSQYLGFEGIAFFTHPVGEDCDKGFRFFWFVWALSTLPPLLAIAASFMPELFSGVSTSFFAVLAPLNILMANSWFDALHIAKSDLEKRMEVVTAGFCVLGGASLLMLLMHSLLQSKPDNSKHVQHSDNEHHYRSVDLDAHESIHHTKARNTAATPAVVNAPVVGVMPPVVGRHVPVVGAQGAVVHEPVDINPVRRS